MKLTRRKREPIEIQARKGSVLDALPEPILPGEKRQLGRLTIWIQEELGDASAKRVYRAAGGDGARYVYKEARDAEVLAKEAVRTLSIAGKLPVSSLLQSGASPVPWLLREWIEGLSGEEWLAFSDINESQTGQREQLEGLVRTASAAGLMVGKLNPENLIWSGGGWWIVDCGRVRVMEPAEALSRYRKKISKRWGVAV